jgi:hypothetical protein
MCCASAARYHDDNGAPSWFTIIKRIWPARLAGPVSDPGGLKQSRSAVTAIGA